LWNSSLGRRSFMKKTGMASAATVIALNGFKVEVLASASSCTWGSMPVKIVFKINADGSQVSGVGFGSTPQMAQAAAVASFQQAILPKLIQYPFPITNPTITMQEMCSNSPLTSVTTTRAPETANGMNTPTPVWDSVNGRWVAGMSNQLEPSGLVVITINLSYGPCPF
jgi:hypothetical protein